MAETSTSRLVGFCPGSEAEPPGIEQVVAAPDDSTPSVLNKLQKWVSGGGLAGERAATVVAAVVVVGGKAGEWRGQRRWSWSEEPCGVLLNRAVGRRARLDRRGMLSLTAPAAAAVQADYAAMGSPVAPTNFIPCKTPMSNEILENWSLQCPPKHALTVPLLLAGQAAAGREVGLIIDLANHDCL